MNRTIYVTFGAKTYTAMDGSGEKFVLANESPNRMYYHPKYIDNNEFYEIAAKLVTGHGKFLCYTFKCPQLEVMDGGFSVCINDLAYNGMLFKGFETQLGSTFIPIPLPKLYQCVYMFKQRNGEFIYVSRDVYCQVKNRLRVWIGDGERMNQSIVHVVKEESDGKSVSIYTNTGTLYIQGAESTYNYYHKLEELDAGAYTIGDEHGIAPTIRLKVLESK
jgi:hypothetical protein